MMLRFTFLLTLLTVFFAGSRFRAAGDEKDGTSSLPPGIVYGEPKPLGKLAAPAISESSGIACSRRREGVFWTHNDSGGAPRIPTSRLDQQHHRTPGCSLDGRSRSGIVAFSQRYEALNG